MWPLKSQQEVLLQQEFVASAITGIGSFSVNGIRHGACTHMPESGQGVGVPESSLCLQRCCVGLRVVSVCWGLHLGLLSKKASSEVTLEDPKYPLFRVAVIIIHTQLFLEHI